MPYHPAILYGKMVEKLKTCSKCKKQKDISEFNKHNKTTDGLYNQCKECQKEAKRIYYEKYKAKINSKAKEKYKNNSEEIKAKSNKYYNENKEKALGSMKRYREDNKEVIKKRKKDYHEKNKDKINEKRRVGNLSEEEYQKRKQSYKSRYWNDIDGMKERAKEYYKNNRVKRNKYLSDYNINRRKNDVAFRITGRLRTRLISAIKNNSKSKSTLELLGCTIDELKTHLSKKFNNRYGFNFNWNNMDGRKYHIDHIMPCASFDLSKDEEQKKCFHYSNLQILKASENLSKGAKIF